MTAHEVSEAKNALRDAAARLVFDREDIPAGSVLRCFSRAVRHARMSGCSVTRLPIEADRLTRQLLAARLNTQRTPVDR